MNREELKHELIIPNDDISFKLFLFEGKDGNYFRDKHWHRSVELFVLLEGKLDFFLNDNRFPLCSGQFVLVNSNEIHSINALQPNKAVVLQIPVSNFHRYYLNNSFIYFSHSDKNADSEVIRLVSEMYNTYQKKDLGYELAVQSLFYQLLYLLVLKYRDPDAIPETAPALRNRSKLLEITDYIKKNYNKKITLDHLGSVFGYSSTYVSRMFRKYAGYSFKKYLDSVRLAYALADLERGEETLDVIAAKHGFPDRKALSKTFQEKYHTTPGQYLRNH